MIELGCKSRWWSRCRHICSKFGKPYLVERSELEWDGEIRDETGRGFLKKHICSRIREVGKQLISMEKYDLMIQKERKSMYK